MEKHVSGFRWGDKHIASGAMRRACTGREREGAGKTDGGIKRAQPCKTNAMLANLSSANRLMNRYNNQ